MVIVRKPQGGVDLLAGKPKNRWSDSIYGVPIRSSEQGNFMWLWCSGNISPCHGEVGSSILLNHSYRHIQQPSFQMIEDPCVTSSNLVQRIALVAQLVERRTIECVQFISHCRLKAQDNWLITSKYGFNSHWCYYPFGCLK